ncbi:MAG TPA: DUF3089 domain-containing protein [Gemmatimonadaceae bacterium]|nr:DUF3089 domain-containing protein [Gemmatimonadaceae bacterium]
MSRPNARRILTAGVLLFVASAALLLPSCAPRLVTTLLDPGSHFDHGETPPAPDYDSPHAWAALPLMADAADAALTQHPGIDQLTAPVDVFFVHPTTWMGRRWNVPFDSDAVIESTARGSMLIQASVFNGCCAVHAPRYRQANGMAFIDPRPAGDSALAVAYVDVVRAFDTFEARGNRGRPFILAGHSQGTVLATRLLRERIIGSPAEERLVAAYLVGGPLAGRDLGAGLELCEAADDVACVVAFNARGPGYSPHRFEFAGDAGPGADPMAGRACVNPLSWTTDTATAPASLHRGAVFLDAGEPRVLPEFATAACRDGTLEVRLLGDVPRRRAVDRILLWFMGDGNYHSIEYQLFYLNLREDASRRVQRFLSRESVADGTTSSR